MFVPMTSRKVKRSACRRMHDRDKIQPTHIACWSDCDGVQTVAAIEADTRGARLMLPWNVQAGESLVVSMADELGYYYTQPARVCWTEKLEVSGRVIAGVEFQEQLQIAV